MKYSKTNNPIQCIMTQSTCYKGSKTLPKIYGILWHDTAAGNPNICRYVQPDDNAENKDELIKLLGKNKYGNDWNHEYRKAGVNAFIGKLADGTITTVQSLPEDFGPWGCGKGKKGSCNNGWLQFEICDDGYKSKDYFDKVYKEACEYTAYLCKLFDIDPKGTVQYNGVTVPTILCHQDSYKLGLGGNHSDVYPWFNKFDKDMNDVRNDVYNILHEGEKAAAAEYIIVTTINRYANADKARADIDAIGVYEPGTYYIYNKYPNGVSGMLNITKDKTGNTPGSWINPMENYIVETPKEEVKSEPKINYDILEWQKAAVADGFKFPKYGTDGKWGNECESVAKQAICKQRITYKYKNLTKIIQRVVGASVDGKFGSGTKKAVKAWQKTHGLIADGAVGPATWKAILNIK